MANDNMKRAANEVRDNAEEADVERANEVDLDENSYQMTWGSTPAFKAEMAEKLKPEDDNGEEILYDSIRAEGLHLDRGQSRSMPAGDGNSVPGSVAPTGGSTGTTAGATGTATTGTAPTTGTTGTGA
jgi:hypothetical protein